MAIDVDTNSVQGGEGQHLSQAGQHDRQSDKFNGKSSKVMIQAKLTSLYDNKLSKLNNTSYKNISNSKTNSSEECVVVEETKTYNKNLHKSQGSSEILQFEDVGKPQRAHFGISSPRNENVKSPPCSEETDASGNGFVSARTKLEMDARQRRGLAGSPSAYVSPQTDNNINSRGYGMRSSGFPRRGVISFHPSDPMDLTQVN